VALWTLAQKQRYAEATAIYRWFQPLLDLDASTKLIQNIKLIERLVIGSNERARAPRLPLVGAERAKVEAIVAKALATRPALPQRFAAE
jgi:4-hydroxy-tetrahydrodipicolinate synthase